MSNIIIYTSGGLGDILVRIPHFKSIRKKYEKKRIILMTNMPYTENSIVDYKSIFPNNIVDEIFEYDQNINKYKNFINVFKKIKTYKAEIIINLVLREKLIDVVRDYIFFYITGIKKKIGFKYIPPLIEKYGDTEKWQSVSISVKQLIAKDIDVEMNKNENWSIIEHFNPSLEINKYVKAVTKYIVISLGGKYDVQQWGDLRWKELIIRLIELKIYIIFIGSVAEGKRVENIVANISKDKYLNLCGLTNVKESAYIIFKSKIFIGQDSGPMHLSASVNKNSIIIHSARTKPGEWFPLNGNNDNVYKKTDCFGCYKKECIDYNKKCITQITVEEIFLKIEKKYVE